MAYSNDTLGQERDQILERLIAILKTDDRVRAAWLSGSFGRAAEDDWSDLDLHIAVRDEQYEYWLTERPTLYPRIGQRVLVRADKPSNVGTGTFQEVIFNGPVTLDLNLHPASTARRGIDTRVLFDRLPLPPRESTLQSETERNTDLEQTLQIFWAMTLIALKYVARGQTQRAVTQLDLPLGAYVDVWRTIHQPDRRAAGGAHWLHPIHDAALRERLPVLAECIDSRSVFDAISRLMVEMIALHPPLERLGVFIPADVAQEVTQFRDYITGCRFAPPELSPVSERIIHGK